VLTIVAEPSPREAGATTSPQLPPAGLRTVFLVEDHAVFREQLARMLARDARFRVCGEADNIGDALAQIIADKPDLVLADVTLKGDSGLELIKRLQSRDCTIPVLVLSMHEESVYAERALRAGASGYLTKHQASEHLGPAITRVLEGNIYLSAEMTRSLLQRMGGRPADRAPADLASLSAREQEIFGWIGRGLSTREIALRLHLGDKTVHSHRHQIKAKLGIRHSAELYNLAARWVEERSTSSKVGIAPNQKMQQNESPHA
jgi:DNA-binding NarL/FixJ family response regulator